MRYVLLLATTLATLAMADESAVGNNNEWVWRDKYSRDVCAAMRRINALEYTAGQAITAGGNAYQDIYDLAYGYGRDVNFYVSSHNYFSPCSLAVKNGCSGLVVGYNRKIEYEQRDPGGLYYATPYSGVAHFRRCGRLLDDFYPDLRSKHVFTGDNTYTYSGTNYPIVTDVAWNANEERYEAIVMGTINKLPMWGPSIHRIALHGSGRYIDGHLDGRVNIGTILGNSDIWVSALRHAKAFNDGTYCVVGQWLSFIVLVWLTADFEVHSYQVVNNTTMGIDDTIYQMSVAHNREDHVVYIAIAGTKSGYASSGINVSKWVRPAQGSSSNTPSAYFYNWGGQRAVQIAYDELNGKVLLAHDTNVSTFNSRTSTYRDRLLAYNSNLVADSATYLYLREDTKVEVSSAVATTDYEDFRWNLTHGAFPDDGFSLRQFKQEASEASDGTMDTGYDGRFFITCDERGYLYMLNGYKGLILRYKLYWSPTSDNFYGASPSSYNIGECVAAFTHWGDLLPSTITPYDLDNLPANVPPSGVPSNEQEPTVTGQIAGVDIEQTTWYVYNSDGSKTSMGVPDGGVNIPDLERLARDIPETLRDPTVRGLLMGYKYITDMRRALEALAKAGVFHNAAGEFYNWSYGSATHLLYASMNELWRFYGRSAPGYDWTRKAGALVNYPLRDVDIGEIYECIRLLEDAYIDVSYGCD